MAFFPSCSWCSSWLTLFNCRAFGPFALVACTLLGTSALRAAEPGWKAGVARAIITPAKPMWLSGYGSRNRPADGKLQDLWAKALLLQDVQGTRGLLLTMDLVGISRDLSSTVRDDIARTCNLPRDHIILSVSHTHSGPVVDGNLMPMYDLDATQTQLVHAYSSFLRQTLVDLASQACRNLEPAEVRWGSGQCGFAVNRRNNKEADVPRLLKEATVRGPSDHDVPVLAVYKSGGELKAVAFGYACHATVLDGYQWSPDYPGAAQAFIEQKHPGVTALFWAGCGGDQNPLPRRKTAYVEQYGKQLGEAVNAVLARQLPALAPRLRIQTQEIPLPFADIPSRDQLLKDAKSTNRFVASRAKYLLDRLTREGSLSPTYPYPVMVWRLGDNQLTWVALGGEVVVDYALRLKKELGPGPVWVAGYCTDVMAYIPSLRVLREGGYEGGGAMVYYGQPAIWAQSVEELIVAAAHALARQETSAPCPALTSTDVHCPNPCDPAHPRGDRMSRPGLIRGRR